MQHYQPKSMLVTGGAGFIGAHFIRHVLKNDPNIMIVNLDKLTYAGSYEQLDDILKSKHHHFIRGDITDPQLVRHILQHHHIDTVVHFAAESHVDRSITSPQDFVQTNLLGTFVLLESARHHWFEVEETTAEHCRFHHISTDEVYGSLKPSEQAFNESTRYNPRSPYSATKAGSDHLVNAYYHTYGLPITVSHCSNNYGPKQHNEKFIPTIINQCLRKQPIPIYGEGKNIRDWLYVEDHCRGILSIIKNGRVGECYNMGADNEWENLKLAHFICKQMDLILPWSKPYHSLITHVEDRKGHDFRYAIDSQKIKNELHWQPEISFEKGMQATIQAIIEQEQEFGKNHSLINK